MAADWRELYPFESHFLDLDGAKYHYIDEGGSVDESDGEPGDQSPIVCVHGNPTWSFYWRNLIQAFRDRHRVIAVDHIGSGLSSKPKGYNYRLSQHSENLKELLTDLDIQNATLVVHDWGGPIGLGALMHVPHRFKRVVLLNTAAYAPDHVPMILRIARSPIVGQIAVQGMNQFMKSAFKTATKNPAAFPDAVKAGFLHPYPNWGERRGIYAFVRDIPVNDQHPSWNQMKYIEEGLSRLQEIPVQMIWGMQDWCFSPEVLARMRQLLPNAGVHEIADAGHFVMEDARDEVVQVIGDFLNLAGSES